MSDPDQADADICIQQPFFASAEAATDWLAAHPGGKVLPVKDFDRMWRKLLDETQPRR